MRWQNLAVDTQGPGGTPPLFDDAAVIRRFRTPEFAGITFYEVHARSIINHVPSTRLGFSWTINPYRGCSHACSYCFARPTHTYLDFNSGEDFERQIVVKVNAAALLRRELRRRSWAGEHIAMGTNTDPYQRAEGHYRLMRGILSELNAAANPYSILTKGTLIQRDIDLLQEGAARTEVSAAFSVGTVDEEVWRRSEPGTPHPMKRLETVRKLNDAGIPTGVMLAPVLPGISDSPTQLKAAVRAAVEAGATHITPIVLHLRKGVKEEFMPWLEENYPHLVGEYQSMYRGTEAPAEVRRAVASAARAARGSAERQSAGPRGIRAAPKPKPAPVPRQGRLALEVPAPAKRRAPKWVRKPLEETGDSEAIPA